MDDSSGNDASSPSSYGKTSATKLELKDIERLLEFELKRFDESQRSYGWTPWGLMVALAALAWHFGDRAKSPGNWDAIGLWWAAIILLLEFLYTARTSLPRAGNSVSTHVRYFSTNWILAGSREYIVVDGLVRAGACLIILALGQLTPLANLYWWIPTIISVASLVLGLFVAGDDYPLRPDFERSIFARIMRTASFCFGLIEAVIAAFIVYRLIRGPLDYEAMRTAGLLVVATKVLSLLAEHRVTGPFQERLAELRRAIGFGELTIDDARRSLDETLRGVGPLEHLRRHFRVFEESSAHLAATHTALQQAIKELAQALAGDGAMSEKRTVASTALQSAKTAMKQNNKHAEKINNIVLVLWLQGPEIIRDVKPVIGKYRDERKARRATHDGLLAEWKTLSRLADQRSVAGGAILGAASSGTANSVADSGVPPR